MQIIYPLYIGRYILVSFVCASFADSFKPVIAHRDFNSRNVLMKSDLTCVICDLGFAMATSGSKLIKNGVSENAEQSSLTDVSIEGYVLRLSMEQALLIMITVISHVAFWHRDDVKKFLPILTSLEFHLPKINIYHCKIN